MRDGLNVLSEHMDYLCGADCEHFIFTPHMKEFERISGLKIAEVKRSSLQHFVHLLKEYDVTCVLKDSRTTIAKPRERVAVNLSGCAAMAKAGSGDVLAGIIASYLAQGLSEWEAALLGVYIHGRAGEIIEEGTRRIQSSRKGTCTKGRNSHDDTGGKLDYETIQQSM
ncbi:MAG: NAD(P)H-hydrate dehydratase [Dorea sp.]